MSTKAKMMHYTLKYRHLFKGQLRPEVIDKNTSIEKLRRDCDETAERFFKTIPGISFKPGDYPNFYTEWVESEEAPAEKVVLYFHGGGFVMGNARSHRNIVGNFVKHLGIKALVFDYRLAPENPAPAAVDDSAAVYSWLLEQGYQPENIAFAGDSAGGGIALATLLKCKDDGIPLPGVCAVFSPCTDMTLSGESHNTRAKADPCTPKGANETYLGYYVGSGDRKHPYASPLFGDLSGLPPTIIQVGDNETLRDDSTRFGEKANEAGVDVQLKIWKGMFHCFPLLAPMFPEATEALEEVCQFIGKNLNN
ncbi:MAG: alpha/beta hydrolase [Acetobacterium sp.]|uniref:alpha/beta hydrolase n=1 Tax=Acetobacterium sp. TaxID=1872094 RepID=UPI003242C14D